MSRSFYPDACLVALITFRCLPMTSAGCRPQAYAPKSRRRGELLPPPAARQRHGPAAAPRCVTVMAVLVRRGLFVALHHALGQGSSSVCHPALPAALLGACRTKKTWPLRFTQEELRQRLTPMQYHVTQERGTESAFSGEFTYHTDEGTYTCVVCGSALFSSNSKFDSGSGWPSFSDLMKEETITKADDFSYGMHRVEAACSQVHHHLVISSCCLLFYYEVVSLSQSQHRQTAIHCHTCGPSPGDLTPLHVFGLWEEATQGQHADSTQKLLA